jgi:hypothetical protein
MMVLRDGSRIFYVLVLLLTLVAAILFDTQLLDILFAFCSSA